MKKKITISHSRKYQLNEYFFDQWSPPMAYVLGFWFADGYMRIEKSYRIIFVGVDKSIIRQIKNAFASSHPITKRLEKRGRGLTWSLSLCSRYLYRELERHGGHRRKSKTIEFPNVPRKYLPDFIRGYFDGDGSVFFVRYIRTKDRRLTRELRTNFTSGSRHFLDKLMYTLSEQINLPIKKICAYNNGDSLKLGYGMKDSDVLLRYMYYPGFPIGLQRKASFLSRIPKYQRHNMPRWQKNVLSPIVAARA